MLSKDKIIKQFAKSEYDTGSSEVQVGLITERIKQISTHLKLFPKDVHSRLGLVKLVGKRRSLLTYLKRTDKHSYVAINKYIKEQRAVLKQG